MIWQKPTKTITEAYTTTDADNGYRIIVNSSSAVAITLHSATGRVNFELEIDNIGSGNVTVGGQTLKQYTHAHVGNNGGTAWSVVVGGGSMSKAEIEAVLTGEISSHSHAGGSVEQATETTLGGIKAKAKTTESSEVAIDGTTGKLYVAGAGEAENGLPAGGTAGQVLIKASATDFDAGWKKPVTLKNLATNPSFEDGTTGWTTSGTITSVTTDSRSGYKCVLENANGEEVKRTINARNGHILYVSAWYKQTLTSGYSQLAIFDGDGASNAVAVNVSTASVTAWTRTALLKTAASNGLYPRVALYGAGSVWWDDITVVDMTEAFGAGNEKTLADMNTLIDQYGGFVDGYLTVFV